MANDLPSSRVLSEARLEGTIMLLIAIALIAGLLTSATRADTMARCGAAWKAQTPEAAAAGTYQAWSATRLANSYTAPTAAPPTGATAMCNDGTYSMAQTAFGRCNHHGGVRKIL